MGFDVRRLSGVDAAQLDAFLKPHTAFCYYMRSNAVKAGLDYHGQFLGAEYVAAFQDGRMVGAASYSWIDSILVFATQPDCLPALAEAMRGVVVARGGKLDCILGMKHDVDPFCTTLGLSAANYRDDDDEYLFAADLRDLPAMELAPDMFVRLANKDDRALLIKWRVAFNIEAVNATPGAELEEKVRAEIDSRLPLGELFVLEKSGVPVSYCGIGGSIPEMEVVGPVWTPPELRGHRYAQIVTAWGLRLRVEASKGALKEGVLFASRPDAIRVYEKLGFHKIGDWALKLLKSDYRMGA